MKLEHAEEIVIYLQGLGHEVRVYEDYSGRGMYGETTAGITGVDADPVMIGYAAGLLEIPSTELPRRSDSLGYNSIYY